MEMVKTNVFTEMSFDEMQSLDGGAWSWKEFARNVVGGGVSGAVGGAVAGGGAGAVPGAIGGALGGAALYLVCGWW